MVWYTPWTWYRSRRIEELNPQNKQQSNLERGVSGGCRGSSCINQPDGEFAGRYSIGSRHAGSYTNEEVLGPGSAPSDSFADDVNSAEASGIQTGYYNY